MDYNAQVPRRRIWLVTGLFYGQAENESSGQQVITTVLFVPYISPEESKQLAAGHCNLFPYPRYPWEKKGSYGSCTGAMNKDAWLHAPRTLRVAGLSNRPRLKYSIMIVLQLVHPLRARCFARCCTTPVLADELEYREKPFFFSPPTFSPGWEVDSLCTHRKKRAGVQNRVELYCEVHLSQTVR